MALIPYSKKYTIYDYSSQALTYVPLEGELMYLNTVITGQIKNLHIMGDGSSQINQLPFIETIEIHTASNVDLETLRIIGNRVKIFNSGSAAITVQTGTTGTPTTENINAKCTVVAFFDGTYWRLDDPTPLGTIQMWHQHFDSGTLSLPWGWALMDATVIDDPESPFDGATPEDLIGDARFIRAGATSGVEQGHAFQGHRHGPLSPVTTFLGTQAGAGFIVGGGTNYTEANTTGDPVTDGSNGTPVTASETRPINMTAVMIIKIK